MILSRVVLPQPDGPTSETSSPLVDVERGVGDRQNFLAADAEHLADALQADEGLAASGRGPGHTVSTRESRTTNRRSRTRTIR